MAKPQTGLKVDQLDVAEVESSNDLWKGLAHVYVKHAKTTGKRLILHEYLAARLANFVGIPVPFGEITSLPKNREAWVSGITTRDGKVLPPPDMLNLVAQERHILSGILVFDQWIFNADRDVRNLVWSADIGLWAIDHELAFCGSRETNEDAIEWLDENRSFPLTQSEFSPYGLSGKDFEPWINHIWAHGEKYARDAVVAAYRRGLGSRALLGSYQKFLVVRASQIRNLTNMSRAHAPFKVNDDAQDSGQLL